MTVPEVCAPSFGPTLIVGSTGFIGNFVAKAFLAEPSKSLVYILLQHRTPSPAKAQTIKFLKDKGAIILHGAIGDRELMERILRELQIEVVVSAVGGASTLEQLALVQAISAAGCSVKRFLPSEFGHDIDRAEPVEPGLMMYNEKRMVRRAVEKAGIPYTYICCNSVAAWPYHTNHHPADALPPLDHFGIYGDGNVKAYFVGGGDIGKFTVLCSRDNRTVNKTVHFRPPRNLVSVGEMAALWEKNIARTLPRVTITESDLLATAKEMRIPESIVAAITHDIFINGCQTNFCIDKDTDLEVTALYPDIPFRSLDDCFQDFIPKIIKPIDPPHSAK